MSVCWKKNFVHPRDWVSQGYFGGGAYYPAEYFGFCIPDLTCAWKKAPKCQAAGGTCTGIKNSDVFDDYVIGCPPGYAKYGPADDGSGYWCQSTSIRGGQTYDVDTRKLNF